MASRKAKRKERQLERDDARSVAVMQRLKVMLEHQATDPKLGTEPGKLFVLGHITAWQHEACNRWGWILFQHGKVQEYPHVDPPPAAAEREYGKSLVEPDEEWDAKILTLFRDGLNELQAVGMNVPTIMSRVCLRNEPPTDPHAVKAGAAALCRLWGMGKEGADW